MSADTEHVLFVCTGNLCRSPLAEALLRRRLEQRGVDGVVVSSAGTMAFGASATAEARQVAEEWGGDLRTHRAQRLDAGLIASGDLVVGMTADHVIDLVHHAPSEAPRIFKMAELARVAEAEEPRSPGETLRAYAERLGAGRPDKVWASSRSDLDVADPMGETVEAYRHTADHLDKHLTVFVENAWPV